jgi:hypothetical protein
MGRIRDGKETEKQGKRRNKTKEKDRRRAARSILETRMVKKGGRERRNETEIF